MTKVFALLSIAAVFAFASCADKKVEETAGGDTTAVVVPVDTTTSVAPDTAASVAPDTAKAAH